MSKTWGWIIGIIIVLVLIGAAIWYNGQSQEPATEGDTVAVVNGAEITRVEFEQRVAALEAQAQAEATPEQEQQILQDMIDQRLVLADAETRGITVTAEEVDQQYQQITAGFPDDAAFQAALVQNNTTEAEVKADIETQLLLQKYAVTVQNENNLEVTDEEVRALYDQLTTGEGNEPAFEEVEAQLRQQIGQQELNQVLEGILTQLRADAEIEVLL